MPVNVWVEEINIAQHVRLDHDIDIQTESGIAEFEEIKTKVCDELRKARLYRSPERLKELWTTARGSDELGEGLVVAGLIRDLEAAHSPEKFTEELQYVYMWGDKHRVWLGGDR